jgi:hypothetical protein
MCWHRLNRLVQLSHELRKPIGGDEHVVDLRVVNPLDRPGLDALQDLANRRERREGSLPRTDAIMRDLVAGVTLSVIVYAAAAPPNSLVSAL